MKNLIYQGLTGAVRVGAAVQDVLQDGLQAVVPGEEVDQVGEDALLKKLQKFLAHPFPAGGAQGLAVSLGKKVLVLPDAGHQLVDAFVLLAGVMSILGLQAGVSLA